MRLSEPIPGREIFPGKKQKPRIAWVGKERPRKKAHGEHGRDFFPCSPCVFFRGFSLLRLCRSRAKAFYWISCGGSAESTERLFVPISEKETIGFVEVN